MSRIPPPPPTRPENHSEVVRETLKQHFVDVFNTDPLRAVKFLTSHKVIERSAPVNIASFLLDSKLNLSKTRLGEYMCIPNNSIAKIVGETYASKFDFKMKSIGNALRSFFEGPFLIPKEMKGVEYLSKLFSKRYYNTNHSNDSLEVVFVLSFSALMMSISVHGHRGNRNRRKNDLSLATFSSRIRAIESCKFIEDQLIKQLYDDVLHSPVHRGALVESKDIEEDSRSRSDRSSSVASHSAMRKLSPHLRLSSPGMMNMVDNLIRLGIVDSDLVTKVMQCVDRKLFLDAKNLKLAYDDRRLIVESADESSVLLRPSMYAASLGSLELHLGLDVLHVESGTGYMTALLAAAVGKQGRVSAVDVSPFWSKKSRCNVAAVRVVFDLSYIT